MKIAIENAIENYYFLLEGLSTMPDKTYNLSDTANLRAKIFIFFNYVLHRVETASFCQLFDRRILFIFTKSVVNLWSERQILDENLSNKN